ncbi:hypothetical protein [Haloterrigena salinisoli]|uniref:hypothetical protein n=1 Tax=Haloterrigena salinisoli TaxID=3132747 RepID=UPI0030D5C49F
MAQLLDPVAWDLNLISIVLGALVGMILQAFIGPYVSSIVTSMYVSIEAPKYESPELDVTVVKERSIYQEGESVECYDGLEWDNEYSVYRFVASNNGESDIENLKLDIPLPGYSVYTNTDDDTIGGNYVIYPLLTTRVQTTGDACVSEKNCSFRIKKEKLAPDNTLAVEFVISQKFEKCDVLRAFSPRPEVSASFDWYVNDSRNSEVKHIELNQFGSEYYNALHAFENYTEGPSAMEMGKPYHILIVGIEDEGIESAIENSCM